MKSKMSQVYVYLLFVTILPLAGWFLYIKWNEPIKVNGGLWIFLLLVLFQVFFCWRIAKGVTAKNRELEESNRHLNEVDRLKTEFLANVSHELRTPLTVIMGYSELLTEQYRGTEEEGTKGKFTKTIYEKSEDLLNLINDLIELSRIESGRLEMNFKPVAIEGIIKELVEDFSREVGKKRQTLQTEFRDTPLVLKADRGKMKQIIRNLIENSIKYTPDGGKIIVRAYGRGQEVYVEVEDNGIGIAEENLEHIYQPFTQVKGPYNKKSEGFGLGLTITKNLVKCHKGTIHISSMPGKGSIFTIHFPRE